MKGYFVSDGYLGFDPESKKYIKFATEQDYIEWFEEFGGLNEA